MMTVGDVIALANNGDDYWNEYTDNIAEAVRLCRRNGIEITPDEAQRFIDDVSFDVPYPVGDDGGHLMATLDPPDGSHDITYRLAYVPAMVN